jgi:pyrroloquinoline quinone biosynthesis protein B
VVLMDAHIDHVAGLLSLREGPRLNVFATPAVFEDLTTGLPLFHVLENYCGIRWQVLPVAGDQLEANFQVPGMNDLRFTALAMPGDAPPYSLHRREATAGDHIAVLVEDLRNGHRLFYSPGPVAMDAATLAHLQSADRLLIDGSDWPGKQPALAASSRQNVLIHVNVAPLAAQVELAYDGMEIEL